MLNGEGILKRLGDMRQELAQFVGLRNRIAHEYEEVLDRLVYDSISRVVTLFQQYLASVSQHVQRQEADD